MTELNTTVAQMVQIARSKITEHSTPDIIARYDSDDVVMVDLRDVRERQRSGYIPGSYHAPRGMIEFWIDPSSPYHKDVFSQDKEYVFYCASGWRSALTVSTLLDMGFKASHLKDGFTDWVKSAGPIEKSPQKHEA